MAARADADDSHSSDSTFGMGATDGHGFLL